MFRKIFWPALVFSFILLVGCNKDFLERTPLSQISPKTAFNTEAELQLYINSFYEALPNGPSLYSEDADNIAKSSVAPELTGNRTVPVSGGGWTWGELRNINYFLENYNKGGLSSDITRKYVGVAKFYRAYFYFNKVMQFGDVPWYSHPIQSDDSLALIKARDPRTLVMDSIMADINFAIENCITSSSPEKITKWTALALKSRICLFEGTFRKYHTEFNLPDASKFLQECVKASEELIAGKKYSLYNSTPDKAYGELFSSLIAIPQEIILTRRFSTELQVFHNVNDYTLTATQGKPGLTKNLINTYLLKDGTRFTDIPRYDTIEFFQEMQNRDPRLSQTIRTPGYTRINENIEMLPRFGTSVTGYQPTKFVTSKTGDGGNRSNNDLPIFRYAEVLLNIAEAKAEMDNITQNDVDATINLIRKRVGMPNLNMKNANTNPDSYLADQYKNVTGLMKGIILEIRRERRIELVMEGFRWNDLYRWKNGQLVTLTFKGMYFSGIGGFDLNHNGKYDVFIYTGTKPTVPGPQYLKLGSEIDLENGINGGNVIVNKNIPKKFNENRDYLYPIPTQELLLNKNLIQNPGW